MRFGSLLMAAVVLQGGASAGEDLAEGFRNPPASARPGVYWYFMDGNLSREGMTADLEAMKAAGIGNLVFLEVNVGVPRGPIDFLSDTWQELFAHAVREAERLGIEITLGSGPGWAGSGGPWVKPEQSMQHLVGSSVDVKGPAAYDDVLPRPDPRRPYFDGAVTGDLIRQRDAFYEDVAVLAYPTPEGNERIADVDEKALYYRAPYTSRPGVKPYLPAPADHSAVSAKAVIEPRKVVDLTARLQSNGRIEWDVPAGEWTIMRFGRRNNGATTRPAPKPGLGFECDKFDAAALDAHFDAYVGKLIEKVGPRTEKRGWTMLHIDSWEMGAQNWTPNFRDEFRRRRGYDPLPFLPAYTGRIVGSLEKSERFLWDVRQTAQDLVLENHAGRLKELGRRHGFGLSIEPYDMNPTSDLDLGAIADVPMCEFWSEGFGFDSSFSCCEATSIAHTLGRPVVAAEAFTAASSEAWKLYPAAIKNQGDWAFATGINRFVYHTFAHKPQGRRPGMTMGPYGVHWDRGQTWWPMAAAYHRYVTRCQFLLRQGHTVADVCYLAAEGAPHVFRPPPSALQGSGSTRDRRGHNFDGCSPGALIANAAVKEGHVIFPGGATYRLLVLPACDTMTPPLARKIKELVEAGATVVGSPPRKSPSLVDYPQCDDEVAALATAVWGRTETSGALVRRDVVRGRIVHGGDLQINPLAESPLRPIERASWIWHPEDDASAAEPGTRYFRRVFTLSPGKRVVSARIEITADNGFEAWINGRTAVQGVNFHTIFEADVAALLKPGENTVAVEVSNAGDSPNPAGLIASLYIDYEEGGSQTVGTDRLWQAARQVDPGWLLATESTNGWAASKVLGPARMSPWQLNTQVVHFSELYPHYTATARLLAEAGLPPDFESEGPIRYTHRRAAEADIYFVANRESDSVETTCTFRVAGKRPELWDPIHGTIRDLPEFSEDGGRTTVPMRFEPHQSFFVVFRPEAGGGPRAAGGKNFPEFREVGKLEGPWDVSFEPDLGGPRQVTFTALEDWSRRPEPGIKYYSGIATYRNTFDLPESLRGGEDPIRLDLGTVQVMARVRLNGRDLGVVWCTPWSVDITDAVRAEGNRLEIEVANLWPNRLIGDQLLPPDRRVAWTTFNPYRADSPLLPSGLLGPVRVKTIATGGRK